jgi:signal transduction histidine kinase
MVRSMKITDSEGKPSGYLLTSRDITKEEIFRERLYRYNTLLNMINKILRHDLLNELLVMQISVERSIQNGDVQHLKTALRSMNKSKETIKSMRMLEIESLREEDMKAFKISDVIDKVVDHDELEIHLNGNVEVMADEGIYSVFNNLINNSIRHGKARNIFIRTMIRDDVVTIFMRDDGSGIPQEIKGSIFREGITFGEAKGSGLGLFLVRRSMHRFGGAIKLDPKVDSGAGFILTFPRSEGEN